jgi:cytochrome c oxidase subunit 4
MDEEHMLDPHGYHAGDHHHGHVIIPQGTLLGILLILLVFTVMTVLASRAEIVIAETFDLNIPQWVNIMVAMSIATVKSILVGMFFMQLKYDNKLNAVIFLASLFCVGLFLGFTMLDLGVRGSVYAWKDPQIVPGGTGSPLLTRGSGEQKVTISTPITAFARDKYIQLHGESEWERKLHESEAASGHAHHVDNTSSADKSRPRSGVTPGLFDAHAAPAHGAPAHAAPSGGGH